MHGAVRVYSDLKMYGFHTQVSDVLVWIHSQSQPRYTVGIAATFMVS
jgi:hypothetical protein